MATLLSPLKNAICGEEKVALGLKFRAIVLCCAFRVACMLPNKREATARHHNMRYAALKCRISLPRVPLLTRHSDVSVTGIRLLTQHASDPVLSIQFHYKPSKK